MVAPAFQKCFGPGAGARHVSRGHTKQRSRIETGKDRNRTAGIGDGMPNLTSCASRSTVHVSSIPQTDNRLGQVWRASSARARGDPPRPDRPTDVRPGGAAAPGRAGSLPLPPLRFLIPDFPLPQCSVSGRFSNGRLVGWPRRPD